MVDFRVKRGDMVCVLYLDLTGFRNLLGLS